MNPETLAETLDALYDAALTASDDDISAARAALTALPAADVRTVACMLFVIPRRGGKAATIRHLIGRIEERRDRYHRAAAFSAGPAAPLCPDVTVLD